MNSIAEYLAAKEAVDPAVQAVLEQQNLIESLEEDLRVLKIRLEEEQRKLSGYLSNLGDGYDHDAFEVVNLTEKLVPDKELVKRDYPEFYRKYCVPSSANLMKLLKSEMGLDPMVRYLQEQCPEKYDELCEVRLSDIYREFSDSRQKKKMLGKLYRLEYVPAAETRLVRKQKPLMFSAPKRCLYPCHDEEDD